MVLCPSCGSRLVRRHRSFLQKLLYSDRVRCSKCKFRGARLHPVFASAMSSMRFVFSRCSRCPRCESYDVHRVGRPDRIDSFSTTLAGLLQLLTGAPVNKCPACRLQFYDWRKPRRKGNALQHLQPNQTANEGAASPSLPNTAL